MYDVLWNIGNVLTKGVAGAAIIAVGIYFFRCTKKEEDQFRQEKMTRNQEEAQNSAAREFMAGTFGAAMNETEKGEMSFSGNPMTGEQDFMKNEVPVSQPLLGNLSIEEKEVEEKEESPKDCASEQVEK